MPSLKRSEMHSTLGKILDKYDETRRAAEDRKQRAKIDDAPFLPRFAELRRSAVRPVFEAVGVILNERGHEIGPDPEW